jgi:hypothetical protein
MNFPSSFAVENVEFSNFRAVDFMGTSMNSIQLDQQVQFTADIKNNQNIEQDFAFVVTIDNLQKQVKWITGRLAPGQTLSPAVSFSFDSEKKYQVDAYLTLLPQHVLDENDPTNYSHFVKSENHLASPLKASFTVGGSISYAQHTQKQMVPEWIRNNAAWWSDTITFTDIQTSRLTKTGLIETILITPSMRQLDCLILVQKLFQIGFVITHNGGVTD